MDAFETIRQIASELHDKLVAAGADADKPLALVEAAVRQLGLELAWLPAGDPALKAARALFDDQAGMLCCTNDGDEGARACLVAHEIGHVCVHSASSNCSTHDIDPSRSSEAAPVGLQRVEDYGAHERRELQANVFAREFLLPRAKARRRYIASETASEIATATGLPKDLVRQQLLDALLLPPAVAAESATAAAKPPRPDPSQIRAAAHRGTPFQLQAGPGTGKTRTLIDRVVSLISEGVDPAAILVLTFSNRAAGELSERLTAKVPDAAPRIWIGTFHAFGLDLVRRYHDRLGLGPDPPLFDRSDAIAVLEEILPTLPLVHYRNLWDPTLVLRDIIGAISRAKDELVEVARYRELGEAMRDQAGDDSARIKAAKALEVAQVYDLYQTALRDHRAVDFGDLIMRPALLLEGDDVLRAAIQLRHRHVLVDEYQDVNRASARLLHAIADDGARLWAVGDARQSIYRFRGASSINMAQFSEDYPGSTVDRLETNYRSSQEVIDTLTALAGHMTASRGMLPLKLWAENGASGTRPELRSFDMPDDEATGVAASVRELEASGVALRDQAILCRTNARLNDIAAALDARGIPVLHLGSLFERDEIRDLLALLSLAVDQFGDGLARVGAMSRYDIPLEDIATALRVMRALPGRAIAKLPAIAAEPSLSPQAQAGIRRLAADLERLASVSSPWEYLATFLLDRTDLLANLARAEGVRQRMRGVAIWQFLNFVRDRSPAESGAPIWRLLDRVRELVLLAEERDLRQIPAGALHMDAVRLMTVHASKGLEFDAVHIPGLTVASFPSSNRGQRCPPPVGMIQGWADIGASDTETQETEEQCLFFVALSRARVHLRLYHARKQPNGNNRAPSPFLAWLPPGQVPPVATPPMMPLPADFTPARPIEVNWPAEWSIDAARLGIYERCPRRFFYTHVLGLGGGRKPTAFTRTHDCLYGLIGWLADAHVKGAATLAEANSEFDRLWSERGPVDHAYAADYRRLAGQLIETLVRSGAGRHFENSTALPVQFASGQVLVKPDEMTRAIDGTVTLRRIRTGYKRDQEYDRLEYTLYLLAGQANFPGAFAVEAVHLTDATVEPVTLSPGKFKTRSNRSADMVNAIRAGQFPPQPDAVSCPRCPHFFVCDAVARGSLTAP